MSEVSRGESQLGCPILLGLSESSGLDFLWLETWVLVLRFAQGWLNNQWRNNTWQYYRFLSAVNHIAVGLQLLLWVLLFWNKSMRWERALWKKHSISPVLLIALGSHTIKTTVPFLAAWNDSTKPIQEWNFWERGSWHIFLEILLKYFLTNVVTYGDSESEIREVQSSALHIIVSQNTEILWGTSRHMVSKHVVHVNRASLFTFRESIAVKLIMGEYKC